MSGHSRRFRRLFNQQSLRTVIVPVDDGLIFGPYDGLLSTKSALTDVMQGGPDAVLAFPGIFHHFGHLVHPVGWIVNLSASTTRSVHTRKHLIGSVEGALRAGADCVAIHVNVSSRFEGEMLKSLGDVAEACRAFEMPLLAIMYPRAEGPEGDNNYLEMKGSDLNGYTRLVAHCARIGMELGADVVKTQYTGDPESFGRVVEAARPVPVVVAGGPFQSANTILQRAENVIGAGAAGVSFGRNVFSRRERGKIVHALAQIVHHGAKVSDIVGPQEPTDLTETW